MNESEPGWRDEVDCIILENMPTERVRINPVPREMDFRRGPCDGFPYCGPDCKECRE